jgi:hypothetical protein
MWKEMPVIPVHRVADKNRIIRKIEGRGGGEAQGADDLPKTPGVDVIITIFTNFMKIGVFLKNQCYDPLFAEFSNALHQKRLFFRQKYF